MPVSNSKSLGAIIVIALVGLGACGSDDERLAGTTTSVVASADSTSPATSNPANDNSVLVDAALATIGEGSTRFKVVIQVPATEMGPASEVNAEGIVDFETGDASMSMDAGAAIAGLPAGVEIEPIELRMVDGNSYINMGVLLQAMVGLAGMSEALSDVEWVMMDPAAGSEGGIGTASANTWFNYQGYLLGATQIVEVGPEEIDEVATTHFTAIAKPDAFEAVFADLKDSVPKIVASNLEAQMEFFVEDVPIDVWLDEDGRVVRFKYTVGEGSPPDGPPDGADMMIDFFDYGVEVVIEIPDNAIDDSEFQELMGTTP